MNDATWRQLIADEMQRVNDSGPIISIAPGESVLDVQFNSGFGTAQGPPFTAWTEQRVYFPVEYDGAEWVQSAPRHPNGEVMNHRDECEFDDDDAPEQENDR